MTDFDIAYAVVKLYVEKNNGESGTGTAFFYKFQRQNEEKTMLITNKHVLKDVNQITFFLHSSAKVPNLIRSLVLSGNDLNRIIVGHPSNYDICAIDIDSYLNNDVYHCLLKKDLISSDLINTESIMENIFVVGYPIGIEDNLNKLPIFTTGTTATSISLDYNGTPMIVINAFALPGSSGSPVFIKKEENIRLIGIINSGSVYYDNLPISNLCYAIKSSLLNELENFVFKQ